MFVLWRRLSRATSVDLGDRRPPPLEVVGLDDRERIPGVDGVDHGEAGGKRRPGRFEAVGPELEGTLEERDELGADVGERRLGDPLVEPALCVLDDPVDDLFPASGIVAVTGEGVLEVEVDPVRALLGANLQVPGGRLGVEPSLLQLRHDDLVERGREEGRSVRVTPVAAAAGRERRHGQDGQQRTQKHPGRMPARGCGRSQSPGAPRSGSWRRPSRGRRRARPPPRPRPSPSRT